MKKFLLLCVLAAAVSGCMSRTTGRMQDIFNDSAKSAGKGAGGG